MGRWVPNGNRVGACRIQLGDKILKLAGEREFHEGSQKSNPK